MSFSKEWLRSLDGMAGDTLILARILASKASVSGIVTDKYAVVRSEAMAAGVPTGGEFQKAWSTLKAMGALESKPAGVVLSIAGSTVSVREAGVEDWRRLKDARSGRSRGGWRLPRSDEPWAAPRSYQTRALPLSDLWDAEEVEPDDPDSVGSWGWTEEAA